MKPFIHPSPPFIPAVLLFRLLEPDSDVLDLSDYLADPIGVIEHRSFPEFREFSLAAYELHCLRRQAELDVLLRTRNGTLGDARWALRLGHHSATAVVSFRISRRFFSAVTLKPALDHLFDEARVVRRQCRKLGL